jgi:hypothetical protein
MTKTTRFQFSQLLNSCFTLPYNKTDSSLLVCTIFDCHTTMVVSEKYKSYAVVNGTSRIVNNGSQCLSENNSLFRITLLSSVMILEVSLGHQSIFIVKDYFFTWFSNDTVMENVRQVVARTVSSVS